MSVMVTYAVRLDAPNALAVLDAQLYAAGLRRYAGPGEHWCHVARAVDVLLPLMGAWHAAGMSYADGIGFVMEWLGMEGAQ